MEHTNIPKQHITSTLYKIITWVLKNGFTCKAQAINAKVDERKYFYYNAQEEEFILSTYLL